MSDNAYQLDPFTQITNINFASGNWLMAIGSLGGPVGDLHTGFVELDFPSIAGGTPGFELITAGQIPNPSNPPAMPYTVQAADLKKQLRTNAGADMMGFPISLGGLSWGYMLNFSKLPKSPFDVLFSINAASDLSMLVTVVTFKNNIKAGTIIKPLSIDGHGNFTWAPTPIGNQSASQQTNVQGGWECTVNPSTLSVGPITEVF